MSDLEVAEDHSDIIGLGKRTKILKQDLNHSKRALADQIMFVCLSLLISFSTILNMLSLSTFQLSVHRDF